MRRAILWLAVATTLQAALAAALSATAHAFPGYQPETIVVKTSERALYYMRGDGRVMVFPVAVGRRGKTWSGVAIVDGKYLNPDWMAPPDMRRARSKTPRLIPGGAPNNPMGVAALTLAGGQYAIHGTNAPGSIGGFVSSGCIRMYNQDITDLYQRVPVGTPVVVVTR